MNSDLLLQSLSQKTLEENDIIEFKAAWPNDLSLIAKIISAFANTTGGYIILGAFNKANKITISGLSAIPDINELYKKLNEYLTFNNYKIEVKNIENSLIMIISVEKADYTTYLIKRTESSERLYKYIREGGVIKVDSDCNPSESKLLYQKVYKYMNLDSFLCSLYGRTLRFSEPSKWPDKFETRFYCANFDNIPNKEYAQRLFATCVTRAQNSEAAWKVYSRNEGLSCHCVQLDINVSQLRRQFNASKYIIAERLIEYKRERYILNLHKKDSLDYKRYFSQFSKDTFLRLLTLKRDAYKYEEEIRFFAIPKEGGIRNVKSEKAKSIDISIDWRMTINKVRIDKKCSQAELAAIIQACHYAGINPIFNKKPIDFKIPPIKNGKDIQFELYDIDDLPDYKKPITIE